MDLKEKYGEWGIVLGATEGVGEAFCKKLAEGGMNIVMVGRREELMREKAEKFKAEYPTRPARRSSPPPRISTWAS